MPEKDSTQSFEKTRRIYSERRKQEISVRISYDVTEMNGGQLIQLKKIEPVLPEHPPEAGLFLNVAPVLK